MSKTIEGFTLENISAAKTSQLIAILDPEIIAACLDEAGVDHVTKEQLDEIVTMVAAEIDRRIPIPER